MKVLLPVDISPACEQTLEWVKGVLPKDVSTLYLLHVINWPLGSCLREKEVVEACDLLSSCRSRLEKAGFFVEKSDYEVGPPDEEICDYAAKAKVDQVILGSRAGILGSIAQKVLKQARHPVLVLNGAEQSIFKINESSLALVHSSVPDSQDDVPFALERNGEVRLKQVLIPVDGSVGSQRTLEWAADFLDPRCCQAHLLHVYSRSPITGQREPSIAKAAAILQNAQSILNRGDLRIVACEERQGAPSDAIRAYADEQGVELIVIGAHGDRGRGKCLMGGTSRHVFEYARQPVILLNNSIKPSLMVSPAERNHLAHSLKPDSQKGYRQSVV